MRRSSRRTAAGLLALLLAIPAVAALSLALGANPLPLPLLVETLQGGGTDESRYVLESLRIPRTVAGTVAGCCLGVAGALIQAMTRNPLADPGILGVNAGAAFAVALGVSLLGLQGVGALIWPAFAGALVLTAAVYLIGSAGRGAPDPIRLTLAGVALGATLSGLTTAMTLADPAAFDTMRGWHAGSLLGRGLDVVVPVLPAVGIGLLLAAVLAPGLNAVALGEDVARAQGARVGWIRAGVVVAVTLLAGSATAIAGPISFIGLIVPHAVRWLFGVDQRVVLLASAVLAPLIVLAADVLGRLLIAPAEVPVGIVTAFIGAPVLIVLARRHRPGRSVR